MHNNLIVVAIGLTVGVLSATGIFMYHKILANQQHCSSINDLKRINELQAELEALRLQLKQQKKKRRISRKLNSSDNTYTITDNDTDVDVFLTDTDIGDDEFYDCSDGESIISESDIRISEELNELDIILKEIDEQVNKQFDVRTYNKLQTLLKSHQDNIEVIWRFARTSYNYAEAESDKNVKRSIILEGIKHCERVIENKHPDLFKWYAILIGVHGDYLSTTEMIKNGIVFQNYVTQALEIRPDDSELHYLLGRFKYEIASLSWIKKQVATAMFSNFPNSSYEEALNCFETAARLEYKTPYVQLYISKCYIGLNQYSQAIDFLNEVLEKPVLTDEDEKVHTEASKLLNYYSKYS